MIKPITLVASILFCLTAVPKDMAMTDNMLGGYTVLTDIPCKWNALWFEAYATNDKEDKFYACYVIKKQDVYFYTESGTLRYIPVKRFISAKRML